MLNSRVNKTLPADATEITQSLVKHWRPQHIKIRSTLYDYGLNRKSGAVRNSRIQPAVLPILWQSAFKGHLVSSIDELAKMMMSHPQYKGILNKQGNPISDRVRKSTFRGATDDEILLGRLQNMLFGHWREIDSSAKFIIYGQPYGGKVYYSPSNDLSLGVDLFYVDGEVILGFAVRHTGTGSEEHESTRKYKKGVNVITLRAPQSGKQLNLVDEKDIKNHVEKARQSQTASN